MAGQVVIKLAPAAAAARRGQVEASAVDATFTALGIVRLEPIFPQVESPAVGATVANADGEPMPIPDLTAWYRAELSEETTDIPATVAALQSLDQVEYAEPDYVRRPVGANSGPYADANLDTASASVATFLQTDSYNDPLYPQQWHLGAAHVPEAWEWMTLNGLPAGGSPDIVVAVIDTGVDYTHPDLAANMWVNSQEIAGNGIDDDGNGFVDDIHGANVVSNQHSGNPQDDHGHGTHVAGIIAAQANNGIGGVGVAYNAKIMAIKAAQYSGALATSDIAEAIYYAVAQGADVINMSFGGYARSQIEEDALAVAFGTSVLVAAAGNDGHPNEGPCSPAKPMYPAAHNWVLGVMASQAGGERAPFSNRDCVPHTSREYELMAPGVDVWSTLPANQFAAWDGTSMAAPIVAGIAALVRTKWSDKDVYSSRFLMGQIAANAAPVAHALNALISAPQPELRYLSHWLFDTAVQSANNDDDGIVDAGEIVDLAIVIRNHWGKADNVQVTLEAWAEGAFQPDPYVATITGTVDYGAVGSFNVDDNGLIYDSEGAITGVRHPFRFQVDPETPNDHVIPFRVTMTANNGYEPGTQLQTFTGRFYLIVQRGRELPRIISEDMTLTSAHYWLIPEQTLIEAGVTVTVTEGTQVQFWSADPSDPYFQTASVFLQVEGKFTTQGTQELPVQIFPGANYQGWSVTIKKVGNGTVDLNYTKVLNPRLTTTSVDHGYFGQVLFDCIIHRDPGRIAQCDRGPQVDGYISNSIFSKLGGQYRFYFPTDIESFARTSLFDSNAVIIGGTGENNVYLKNYKLQATEQGSRKYYLSGAGTRPIYVPTFLRAAFPIEFDNRVYARLQAPVLMPSTSRYLQLAESFAVHLGGHVVSITDVNEASLISDSYMQAYFSSNSPFMQSYPTMNCGNVPCWQLFANPYSIIGLVGDSETYNWLSGESLSYVNWNPGNPEIGSPYVSWHYYNQGWNTHATLPTFPVLLELPSGTSDTDLEWMRQQILDKGDPTIFPPELQFRNNAILNVWWDPDTTHWMKFSTSYARDYRHYIEQNFWGTRSSTLIDASIQDYQDDFNTALYVYQPILTDPPLTSYPFVVDVELSTSASMDTSVVGAEPVTFKITFNRDMDTTGQPQVSFGPDAPFTDYTVHSIQGGWQDPRSWVGTFNITPITGDGYQLIRVAGAVAADDPWLVTGDDSERFRFEIITSGTESMNLQATGGEGRVELSWSQDDFDLLSGFNIYRATSSNGTYTHINAGLIPSHIRAWQDTGVTPGIPYYYKFTVVKSDMTESDFSNVAQGTPTDTVPPTVSHTPVTTAAPGLALSLYADVTDNVGVQSVTLFYRARGGSSYTSLLMTKTTADRYNATVPAAALTSPGIDYYIEASDGVSVARSGRAENPHAVTVLDRPIVTTVSPQQGTAAGGTNMTISGSNFKSGASVALGGAICQTVVVVSSSQITCVTSAHFPAAVDVVVTNIDQQSGTLLQGYTYFSEIASLSLPTTGGGQNMVVQVPVNLANVSGLVAASLTINFDNDIVHATSAATGGLTSGWSLATNTTTPGQVRLSMASSGSAVAGSGVLAYITFEVVGTPGTSTDLELTSLLLNDGAITVERSDGSLTVDQVYSVAGNVLFWDGGAAIPGVDFTLSGDRDYSGQSDQLGSYTVAGAAAGGYTLTPSKSDDVNGISALDASWVLRHDVGLETLSGHAFWAGDVNRNGAVTAFDAFYILQKAVDLITLPFPGAGAVWRFDPATRSYPTLNSNLANQDFTGVLVGDVTGNWNAPVTVAADPSATAANIELLAHGRDSDDVEAVSLRVDPQGEPLYSLEISIAYDKATHTALDPVLGDALAGWLVSTNLGKPGEIRLALAGATPLADASTVLTLRFRAITNSQPVTPVILAAVIDERPIQIAPTTERKIYLPNARR